MKQTIPHNNQHKPISVLIIDDEEEARANLKYIIEKYCSKEVDINIVGLANSTLMAEQMIEELKPDAVLIDIEMPQENAFHFLERIAPFQFEIIFVTAYDEFALKAFKLNALDYILKPISVTEMEQAIRKLQERLQLKRVVLEKSFFETFSNEYQQRKVQHIKLRNATGLELVAFDDIYFVEAQGAYSKFYYHSMGHEKTITMSHSIAEYEALLPIELFYRVHKSFLVNCEKIAHISMQDSPSIVINPQLQVPISRRRYAALLDFLTSKGIQTPKP